MAAVAFDTYAYVKKLEGAGVPEEQAEVHAEMIAHLIEGDLATKRDLKELEVTLRRDMKELEGNLRHDIEMLRSETTIMEGNLKRDIEILRSETKTMEANLRRDIADVKADMLKWVAGLLVAQAGFIIAAIKLL